MHRAQRTHAAAAVCSSRTGETLSTPALGGAGSRQSAAAGQESPSAPVHPAVLVRCSAAVPMSAPPPPKQKGSWQKAIGAVAHLNSSSSCTPGSTESISCGRKQSTATQHGDRSKAMAARRISMLRVCGSLGVTMTAFTRQQRHQATTLADRLGGPARQACVQAVEAVMGARLGRPACLPGR